MTAPRFDVTTLGQVFTPKSLVLEMLKLRRNRGRVLEPSCGAGAFADELPGCVAIELDGRHAPPYAKVMDFFAYPVSEEFETVIGNPPFVRFQDIHPDTKRLLDMSLFDERANLYYFFIEKCIRHLKPGGELIFVNPREFLKASGAARLNEFIFASGTITDIVDLGDQRVFRGYAPNCVVWRFEKGNFSRTTNIRRRFACASGQLLFTSEHYPCRVSDLFFVKVGGVSGCDEVFANEKLGNALFVCSTTRDTGKLRRMFWGTKHRALLPHKERLLARKIRRFDESNWWEWGREPYVSDLKRVYVNAKTRRKDPFFVHDAMLFDGTVLALVLKDQSLDPALMARLLNEVDWNELGFMSGNRYLFGARSLENAPLPASFLPYIERPAPAEAGEARKAERLAA